MRSIDGGARGVHLRDPDDENTAEYTGYHFEHVFEYSDPIRLSAAHVDDLAKVNPRFAQIFHGNLAEPKLFVPTCTNPFASTKTSATENPLYFDNRKISAPQREKVKEGLYRIFDDFFAAGIIRKGEKE